MPKRFDGLTKEEHAALAVELKDIEARLWTMCNKILSAYGASSRQGRQIEKLACGATPLLTLRSALDDACCRESGGTFSPYFGQDNKGTTP